MKVEGYTKPEVETNDTIQNTFPEEEEKPIEEEEAKPNED
jgi:hypothetical protein